MTFVTEHRDQFGVEPILRVLTIPVSTSTAGSASSATPASGSWTTRSCSARSGRSTPARAGPTGAPRVHAQLRRDGVRTARKRVARLLGAHGLQGAFLRRKWRCSTRQNPTATPAPDLVNRDFTAPAPNRLWVADISPIPTGEGPVWLGERPRRLLAADRGLEDSDRADTDLVLGALEYGVWGRGLGGDQRRLIHHSDRGAPVHRDPLHPATGRRRHPPLDGLGR